MITLLYIVCFSNIYFKAYSQQHKCIESYRGGTKFQIFICIYGKTNILHVIATYLIKPRDDFKSFPVLIKFVAVFIHCAEWWTDRRSKSFILIKTFVVYAIYLFEIVFESSCYSISVLDLSLYRMLCSCLEAARCGTLFVVWKKASVKECFS